MAKQLSYITIDQLAADSSGDLVTTGQSIRYLVEDDVTGAKNGKTIDMDEIDTGDTVAVWWGKVQQQVKDEEGIA